MFKHKTNFLRFLWGIFPWLVVLLIVAFIVSLGVRINKEKARLEREKKEAMKKEIKPTQVITLTLKSQLLKEQINLPAEVAPYEDLLVKAEVSGQVVEVLVREGEMVRKGRVIIRLDNRDYRIKLAQIEASYNLARLDYDRNVSLVEKKVTSKSNLDNIEAKLKALDAQVKEAELALSRTEITAPIDGILNEIKAKQGVFLNSGDPVGQIIQLDEVKVTVGVPESDVTAVFDLMEADVIIAALGGRTVKGKKIFLSHKPRTLARLYDLELIVRNTDRKILPGMFARVRLVKRVFKNALVVPLYAVISHGDRHFVFVENNNFAEKRNVELGNLIDWQVHIKSGLRSFDRVIVVGHRFLNDGQPVEIIKNVNDVRAILK